MHILKLIPLPLFAAILFSGCASTNDASKEVRIPPREQRTYLSRSKPLEYFRFWVIDDKDGMAYQGNCRLHYQQSAVMTMAEGGIPVIEMGGRSARNTMNALIDVSSPVSWMEFTTSQKFDTHFMDIDGDVIPYRGRSNTGGVAAYAAVSTQLRIDQLFMENVPFYVRMATDFIGPAARDIESPRIDAVMGYDNLGNFEFIQFDFQMNTVSFSSTEPYKPIQEQLVNTAKIVRLPGYGLAIEGAILDQPTPVILDPAGDFSLSRGNVNPSTTSKVNLGTLTFRQVPTLIRPVDNAPPRAGRQLLSPYIITICNKQGVVYFENRFE